MPETLDIGKRIRKRRDELGLTLRQLAKKTDLTASFLSQVENGQANTSIGSLRRIAEAMGVSMLHFLDEGPKHNPVVRAENRSRLTLAGSKVSYELLVPDLSRKMEVFQGRVGPGKGNFARKLREPTEECILVLSGTLIVGLEADEYTLGPGDSIYFEGSSLVKLESGEEDEETTWLSVITPPVF